MSSTRIDDTLPRGALSHPLRGPLTLGHWPFSAKLRTSACNGARLRSQLLALGVLRGVAAIALLIATTALDAGMGIEMPLGPLAAALAALVAVEAWLLRRTRQPQPISETEFFAHLMFDVLWLAYVLYWLGGSDHNPFADLFVIYVGMAALVLPWRYVGLIFAAVLSAYGVLRGFHHDVNLTHARLDQEQMESLAHLAHFVLFGAIVAYFGYRLARMNRRFVDLAALAREHDLRSESFVDLAALAAGTAHEMGTPLTTISVLIGEMRRGYPPPAELAENLDVMSDAVQSCKRSLGEMVEVMGADRMPERQRVLASQFLQQLVQRFEPMRPMVPVRTSLQELQTTALLVGAPLRQALLNLLANAADASPAGIEVQLRGTQDEVQIDVLDRGPGIAPEVVDRLGAEVVTTKARTKGSGVGVYLANMTIGRMGGRLQFLPRDGGGTCARVTLPTAAEPRMAPEKQ